MKILSYIFDRSPGPDFSYYIPMIILIVLLIIGSLVFSQYYKQRKKNDVAFKKLFRKVSGRGVLIGILLLFLVAVRWEDIPYFSMRIWLYLSLILLCYLIYHYVKIYKTVYPIEKENVSRLHEKRSVKKARYSTSKKKK